MGTGAHLTTFRLPIRVLSQTYVSSCFILCIWLETREENGPVVCQVLQGQLSRANKYAPQHSRVFKEVRYLFRFSWVLANLGAHKMIFVTKKDKPFQYRLKNSCHLLGLRDRKRRANPVSSFPAANDIPPFTPPRHLAGGLSGA